MSRAGHLSDFSRLRSRSSHILSGTLVCFCCFAQFERPKSVAHDWEVCDWAAVDQGRIADWAAQLPVGEAKREGIVGFAIV